MARITPSINLAHLDALSTRIVVDGTPMLATAIYADAPSYAPIGAPGEGIACVDDVARAAIVYLDEHTRAVRDADAPSVGAHALDQARAALEFTLRMQEPDGRFSNFITDLRGTVNRTGETSRPGLGWWAFRGMWALAHGYRTFAHEDPVFAQRLLAGYRRTEGALAGALQARGGAGMTMRSRGHVVPAWLGRFSPDAVSVAAIAAADMIEAQPPADAAQTARTRGLLATLAEGIAATRVRPRRDGALGHSGHTAQNPEMWHAWGAHEGEALARAGQLLKRRDLVEAARREVEGLAAWELAAGRIQELTPGPVREGQQAYGVTMAVRGAMALYRATGEERYARIAGLHASWFAGNNMAREPMYDPATGRGYDGIDALPRGRNLSSGAESTIEALMARQAILGTPEAERMAQMLPVGAGRTWTSADAAQLTGRGTAALVHRPASTAAGAPPVAFASFASGDHAEVDVDVAATGDYALLAGRMRGGASVASLQFLVDGRRVASLPGLDTQDGPHVALDGATGPAIQLTRGRHRISIIASRGGNGVRGGAALLSSLVVHPLAARATLGSGVDRIDLTWDLNAGRLRMDEHLPVR